MLKSGFENVDLSIPMWSFHFFGQFDHTMNQTPYLKLLVKMKHPENTDATANLMDDLYQALNEPLTGSDNFSFKNQYADRLKKK